MSWLYSRVLVEEYLPEKCSDGELSAQLNGNPMPQAYLSQDKMKDFLRVSRFGMTFKPLTENLGVELLTLYLEDFHAKTLAQQEKVQVLTESDQECGEKWQGSFTKYDQDSHSWKTHQCSLLGDLDEFSGTWPQWGLMRDGECWEQQTLERTIRGTESGLSDKWATPTTMDKLPPKSETALLREATVARPNRSKPANLRDQVSNMEKWPTPVTRDYKDTGTKELMTRALNKRESPGLALVVGAETGGKLNPTWVEWLMGWPLGWTDLKPVETDKSHCVQQPHGES